MAALNHIANLLFLASFLVRDVLWLRLLSVIAGFCLIPYFYFQARPLWTPIAWNLVFMSINAFQIQRLVRERRPIRLSDEQQRLFSLAFRSLKLREFGGLIKQATWRDFEPGACLVAEGAALDTLMVVVAGTVVVRVGDREVARLDAGRFVGEMSFLTGDKTSASAFADGRVRCAAWDSRELRRCLDGNVELRAALQLVLGGELAGKLRRPQVVAAQSGG